MYPRSRWWRTEPPVSCQTPALRSGIANNARSVLTVVRARVCVQTATWSQFSREDSSPQSGLHLKTARDTAVETTLVPRFVTHCVCVTRACVRCLCAYLSHADCTSDTLPTHPSLCAGLGSLPLFRWQIASTTALEVHAWSCVSSSPKAPSSVALVCIYVSHGQICGRRRRRLLTVYNM